MAQLPSLTACSVIDEDQSDCEPETQAKLDYELRLVTNMTTELKTELTTQTDLQLASALRQHLSGVFTDFAHDVNLSFYDTQGDSVLLQKDEHIMNANQASYTLNLPMRHYMHLAAANVVGNELVSVDGDDRCHRSMLLQVAGDTIDSHTTGLFTARQPMEVLGNVSQSFNVHLYMANCAAALVVDTRGNVDERSLRVFSTGFATSFSICDSLFRYADNPPIVRTARVGLDASGGGESTEGIAAFCSVNFPSREPAGSTRTIIETTDPFIAQPGEEALWEFRVYAPQADGSVTETKLRIKEPLRAGQLKIIRCYVMPNGSVVTEAPEVSTSVTLDWKQGLVIE